MRLVKQTVAVAAMAALLLFGGTTAAQADTGTESVPSWTAPAETSAVPEDNCQNVGGGTWCTGYSMGDGGLKYCYSHYFHPTNTHSATVSMAGGTDRQVANAGEWARASITAGWAYTCNTMYNPDL